MSDSKLLRAYLKERSEAAFAMLVSRYLRFVYGICCREVGDHHLAEDVTQTVFLLLANKANRLSNVDSLRSWLFCTARFASKNAVKEMRRRRAREGSLVDLVEPAAAPVESEIEPLLNEALSSLSMQDREVLFLHYFDDRSLSDVGRVLGISTEAAKKRSARAVERLRRMFASRGVRVTAASIGIAILTAEKARAIPVRLAAKATAAHAPIGTSFGWVYNSVTKAAARVKFYAAAAVTAGVVVASAVVVPLAGPLLAHLSPPASPVAHSLSQRNANAWAARPARSENVPKYGFHLRSPSTTRPASSVAANSTAAPVRPAPSIWVDPSPPVASFNNASPSQDGDAGAVPHAPESTADRLRALSGLKREPGLDQIDNRGQEQDGN
ncbi:MAG: RNA polymerase sigma factor [Capsulimonadaceae bacterium]